MDEVWERAVETALDGQTDCASVRTLTLDGAVKCFQGRLPPPSLLEKFQGLEHLSIANVGVSSLERFPRLQNLQKLNLSDNRIAGGLEFLVQAGLDSLRDLDLSNNRIQLVEDLAPLAELKIVSLDLYECPVTRIKDYRSRVFSLIRSLQYLDKMDADENEPPESDEEEEDEEEDDEEDPGSGEVDGEDRLGKMTNGGSVSGVGIIDVDEDEESDADEEETEISRVPNGSSPVQNGFWVASSMNGGDEEDVDVEDEEEEDVEDEDDLGEEIDEEEGEDEDVIEVHEIDDSDDEEDGVEEDEDEDDVEDEEEDTEPGITRRMMSTEGEINGHEQGEEDENGEIGEEEEQGVDEDGEYEDGDGEDEEEDCGTEYLVQPIAQAEGDAEESDLDPDHEEDDVEEEEEEEEEEVEDEDDQNGEVLVRPSSTSSHQKRKREEEQDDEDDDGVVDVKSSKQG